MLPKNTFLFQSSTSRKQVPCHQTERNDGMVAWHNSCGKSETDLLAFRTETRARGAKRKGRETNSNRFAAKRRIEMASASSDRPSFGEREQRGILGGAGTHPSSETATGTLTEIGSRAAEMAKGAASAAA